MQMLEKDRLISEKVNELFSFAKINRTNFLLRSKQTVPRTLEHLIAPMRLSNEELLLDCGISNIVKTQFDIHTIDNIPNFSNIIENDLILKPPKIIDYNHVVQTSRIIPIIPKPIIKQPKEKKVRGSRVMKRSFQASNLPTEDDVQVNKKFRSDSMDGDEYEFNETEETSIQPIYVRQPDNLYQVIATVFNEFWNMEFDDSVVNAFLARINRVNCSDYGLSDFAVESCSLPVIQEKLKEYRYPTVESFYYDFNLLFQNILTYFSIDHPAYKKAKELLIHFEKRWELAKATLR